MFKPWHVQHYGETIEFSLQESAELHVKHVDGLGLKDKQAAVGGSIDR